MEYEYSDAVKNVTPTDHRWRHSTICDECSEPMDIDGCEGDSEGYLQVEFGFCLDISGGYGMFTDLMFSDNQDTFIHLCHDCCVSLIRAFPNAFKRFANQGHHPYEGDEPCCEWGWTVREADGVKTLILGNGTREELE